MGYLRDFRARFAAQLASMTPEQVEAVLNTACDAVLESYRNGQQSAQAARTPRTGRTKSKGAANQPPRKP